jgi:hypothetical protein
MPSDDAVLTWEEVEATFEKLGPAPPDRSGAPQ